MRRLSIALLSFLFILLVPGVALAEEAPAPTTATEVVEEAPQPAPEAEVEQIAEEQENTPLFGQTVIDQLDGQNTTPTSCTFLECRQQCSNCPGCFKHCVDLQACECECICQ